MDHEQFSFSLVSHTRTCSFAAVPNLPSIVVGHVVLVLHVIVVPLLVAKIEKKLSDVTAGRVEITNATIYEFCMFLLLSWKNDFPI